MEKKYKLVRMYMIVECKKEELDELVESCRLGSMWVGESGKLRREMRIVDMFSFVDVDVVKEGDDLEDMYELNE